MPSNKQKPKVPPRAKLEKNKQFKATQQVHEKIEKFSRNIKKTLKPAQLAAFVNINFDLPTVDTSVQNAYDHRKPSIFNDTNVRSFLEKNTFVVVFAHPTYNIEYNSVGKNGVIIKCANINKKLLFEDENKKLLNVLPTSTAFRVQINNENPMHVERVTYNDNKLEIQLKMSTQLLNKLLPMLKCVIYFNILTTNQTPWNVPDELFNTFVNLKLRTPNYTL
ncbi:hypothetical protein [Epiphyas postvittana nucleopolyhedrovirus]|uniref:Uncharacterized protein n=1 Tax=Epiphyas postvittana nucleopolyhedrovirus TaxID=70600 RepID=Q91GD8_NPVEP|nr:hypothetical protein [Epiphyas postvittana nucleopolyhedrovirus]AAK85681.1 unknown [Epiphyas postvittana nucleopolyhedrovirus]